MSVQTRQVRRSREQVVVGTFEYTNKAPVIVLFKYARFRMLDLDHKCGKPVGKQVDNQIVMIASGWVLVHGSAGRPPGVARVPAVVARYAKRKAGKVAG